MGPALKIEGLVKTYPVSRSLASLVRSPGSRPRRRALDGLTMEVGLGERVALVGRNGAGKTTLARVACGVVLPDSGLAQVAGSDVAGPRAWRAKVGMARPDDPALHPRLDVRECLRFHAALYGAREETGFQALEAMDAGHLIRRRIQTLSAGEKARVSLARALSHQPCLLILDELSRVLDPGAAARTRALLATYVGGGRGVLVVTHDLSEASLCDRVVVLEQGRAVASGPWAEVEGAARGVFQI